MYWVAWLEAALEELAALWVRGDSESRRLINAATRAIDEELKSRPEEKGESRAEGERVLFSFPLGVGFEVDHARSVVRIFHVWDIRRKPRWLLRSPRLLRRQCNSGGSAVPVRFDKPRSCW